MESKKSFLLFTDLSSPVKSLSDEEAGKLFKAIFEYHNGGVEQKLSPAAEMAFTFLKQQFNRDEDKYNKVCQRNKLNGQKGGRPKNPEEPKEPSGLSGNPEEPKEPDTGIDTGIDTDNKTKKDKSGKHKYGEYSHVLLTDKNLCDLDQKFGKEKTDYLITLIDAGIEKKGYKYKNHYLVILDWEKRDKDYKPLQRSKYTTSSPIVPKKCLQCGNPAIVEITYGAAKCRTCQAMLNYNDNIKEWEVVK